MPMPPRTCAIASRRPARSRTPVRRRGASSPPPSRRWTPWHSTRSARARSSSSPTASSPATPERRGRLEVLGEDGVGVQGADEALDLLRHVRAHEALVVAGERVRAAGQLLVEALDRVLGEHAVAVGVAVRAVEQHAPVLRARLLPLNGVDELRLARVAGVELLVRLAGGAARRGRRARRSPRGAAAPPRGSTRPRLSSLSGVPPVARRWDRGRSPRG